MKPVLSIAAVSICVAATPEFNRDVRPILSDKCYSCHGPDAPAKKIALRLDSEIAAKADLGGRRAIVEGDAGASELVRRITAEKPALRMPPVYSGMKLTDAEIATLRDWIAGGAKWQKHWSFIPPVRHDLPTVRQKGWARNGIDHFVLARLEREGLKPSEEAAKETLIRRVSLDLTGLPPSPQEVDAFLADRSPRAYEKVVDRLLASPRYGERMAARWLDAARYADSNGYQFDGERIMWRWRDWVIDAFNRNQPYDRFVLEQIAGDMLRDATLQQKIATGFNRNHRANTEDGIVAEEYAVEYVVDRVETTSTVFLGLTLGCARCHTHKYDPFTQKDFYRVFAYFNNVPESGRAMKYGNSPPVVAAPTREQQTKHEALLARMDAERATIEKRSRAIDRAQREWERTSAETANIHWAPSSGLNAHVSVEGNKVFDGTRVVEQAGPGAFDIRDRWTLTTRIVPESLDGSIMSFMVDAPKGKGYGVHLSGGRVHVNLTSNYDSDAIRVETEEVLVAGREYSITATYDGSIMADGVAVYINGQPAKLRVLLNNLYRPFGNAGRKFAQPFRIGGGWGKDKRFVGQIDDVRVYDRVLGRAEIEAVGLSCSLAEIARKPINQRSRAEADALRWHFMEHGADEAARETWQRLTTLEREREVLERTFPTVMVMAENPQPRETFLLTRGAYDKPGEKVEAGVPGALNPLPTGAPNNRLGFAHWVTSPDNPLTARVAVNRFWQMYFGVGLVKTVEDFGLQGEWPSHPELLDWLATEFVRTGWDVKAMQKLIVTSATYRQSSRATPEMLRRDPENRLVARGPRQRLPAEMLRDSALFVSGLLVEKIGGPSVKPYQPAGLWKELAMQDMDYVQSKGDDLYRRSLYTFWKRTIPPPMLATFDAANREACVVRETRTNTPLQALNLMNDVTFVEAARKLAERMIREGGTDPLTYGFRVVTARRPSHDELRVLADGLAYHRDYFSTDATRAAEFLKQGESPVDASMDTSELAAYAAVASLMLNLDEASAKE